MCLTFIIVVLLYFHFFGGYADVRGKEAQL